MESRNDKRVSPASTQSGIRLGVCGGLASLAAGAAGLNFIEGTVSNLLCPRGDEQAFAAALAAIKQSPVPVEAANCLFPGDLKLTGPAVDNQAADAYVATALRRARQAGLSIIVFGSGTSRRVPDGFDRATAADQLVAHMKRWAPMAAAQGVIIALEPLNQAECNIVTSVSEGAGLVRRVDHPGVRLLADTYHMARDNDPPDAIRQAKGLIAHMHCAERDGRGPLGTVGEDNRPYFRALKDIGYAGRVSIEAHWKDVAAQIAPAMIELRQQIETA